MTPLRTLAAVSAVAVIAGLFTMPGAMARPDRVSPPDPHVNFDGKTRLVVVHADTQAERSQVVQLGLDATSRVTRKGLEVILYGERDAQVLRDAGFTWTTLVADLAARERANARADRAYARSVARSPLPSGQDHYRHLADFNADLRELHQRFPKKTRLLTLKHRSIEGRPVRGIEITTHAANLADGKPVFLLMGAHHAREWPTGENAIEYAFDLLLNTRRPSGDPRADRIVRGSRTIIVPIINVDGFAISRHAERLGDFSTFDYEMKRKNCLISDHTPRQYRRGPCDDNQAGRYRGTDLNRNYPGFWGGPGASPSWSDDTYRGDGPGDTPEIANVRHLVSHRQVVSLISLHTFGNLLLRPPGVYDTGQAPDEVQYERLGARMAAANDYTNQPSYRLYDTTGSTEDWSYWNTGGYGFTFEIGTIGFHPPYRKGVVAEYLGLDPAEGAGQGGNREAFYRMSMATLRGSMHARIRGSAPAHHRLEIYKRFITATSPVIGEDGSTGAPQYYQDVLTSRLDIGQRGRFTWDVNPSTRPLVVGRYGRDPVAPPQDDLTLTNPPGVPAVGDSEQTTFTIEGPPDADNGVARVRFGWQGTDDPEEVDWDAAILDPDGNVVAQAATLANPEVATLADPVPGEYTLVMVNYAGGNQNRDWSGTVTFEGPQPATYSGLKEAWILSCTNLRTGRVVATREVVVDRGEVAGVGRVCASGRGATG